MRHCDFAYRVLISAIDRDAPNIPLSVLPLPLPPPSASASSKPASATIAESKAKDELGKALANVRGADAKLCLLDIMLAARAKPPKELAISLEDTFRLILRFIPKVASGEDVSIAFRERHDLSARFTFRFSERYVQLLDALSRRLGTIEQKKPQIVVEMPAQFLILRGHDCKVDQTARCCGPNCSNHENLKKCARCGAARYCSALCQKAAWKSHKPLCLASKK